MINRKNVYFVLILLYTPFIAIAHNTNVTHPLLTLEAIRLIKESDDSANKYNELYRTANVDFSEEKYNKISETPFYWGVWNTDIWHDDRDQRFYEDFDESVLDEEDDAPYKALFSANPFNVISGVVREDTPATKVLNHFYHAYTNVSLCGDDIEAFSITCFNSKRRAMPFLIEAANIYGYEAYTDSYTEHTEEWLNLSTYLPVAENDRAFAKQLAFQSFGETLHHVEDMSSIPHVQGDSHLTTPFLDAALGLIGDAEKDDYEGNYVPNKIFQFHGQAEGITTAQGNIYLGARNNSVPATINSVSDIWSEPGDTIQWDSNSLSHKVFNASIFKGKLIAPGITTFLFSDMNAASGEIKDMFGTNLKYVRFGALEFPAWRIEGVGDWHYIKGSIGALLTGFNDAWWPISEFGDFAPLPSGESYYYIEQKMGDEYNESESDIVTVSGGVRDNLFQEYTSTSDLKDSNIKLLEKFADTLIPLAIEYAAGFSQYWFDHVNSPPYLKAVTAKQTSIPVQLPGTSSVNSGYNFTGYQVHWVNVASLLDAHDEQQAVFTSARKMKRDVPTQPMYGQRELKLTLEFSEAIQTPYIAGVYQPSSDFKVGLRVVTKTSNGAPETIVDDIAFDMTKLTAVETKTDGSVVSEAALGNVFEPHLRNSVWTVTIPESEMQNYSTIEGAVRLVVHAKDKNNHRTRDNNGTGEVRGEQLDDRPQTPARVYAELVNDEPLFKWHTTSSDLTNEYANSKDEKNASLKAGDFAYDYGQGDSNHILWFGYNVDVDALLNNPNTGSGDTVSITSLPKKDEEE